MSKLSREFYFTIGLFFGMLIITIIYYSVGMFEPVPISERKTSCEEKGGFYRLLYSEQHPVGYSESCLRPKIKMTVEERTIKDF